MKISQKELKQLEKEGARVKRPLKKRQPSSKPPQKAVESPKTPEKQPASMRASMKFFEQQAEATRLVVAHNAEMIAEFKEDLKALVSKERETLEYTFDIVRDDDKLLKRVYARPGIIE